MSVQRRTRTSERLTSLVVEGGHRLEGRVDVEGNKNSALPLLAACLLTEEPCVLNNVPRIRDVEVMVDLLAGVGAEVSGVGTDTLRVRCARVIGDEPDRRRVGRLRGSVLLCGPLLARLGRVRLAPPGGDFPARRTLSAHLQALAAMGVRRREDTGADYVLEAPDGLRAAFGVSRRGVGHRHRDRVAGGGRGVRRERDPARGVRAACGRAVPVPHADGCRGRRAPVRRPSGLPAAADWSAPSTGWRGTISRRAAGWLRRRSPAARSRCVAPVPDIWNRSRPC